MEAFEQFVAVALEGEGLVVSSSVKFPVKKRVKKKQRVEHQTHGYEVDLVGARSDRLVLASVKSFFGSRGVLADDVCGKGKNAPGYKLLNDTVIRDGVIAAAAKRYGYKIDQVRVRLYVGNFARGSEPEVRAWCTSQRVGGGVIEVAGLREVIDRVRSVAASKTYINNAVIVAMKVLAKAGLLDLRSPLQVSDSGALEDVGIEGDE